MLIDFNSLLVSIFPGINNQPVAPTANQAGNGSHLIKMHNDLVGALEDVVDSSKYIVLDGSDYTVNTGESLIIRSTNNVANIILPDDPVSGMWFLIINTNGATTVEFLNYGTYSSVQYQRVYLEADREPVRLIYVNSELGWIADRKEIIQTEYGAFLMYKNPFEPGLVYMNDPDDFKMPYKLYGRTDMEVMKDKYMKLRKASHGYIVRLGLPTYG